MRHARHPVPRARRRGPLALGGGARCADQPPGDLPRPQRPGRPSRGGRSRRPARSTPPSSRSREANQTDGYRMVCGARDAARLGRAVNRKRVLRVMRERRLIQRRRRLDRRRRPGFFQVTRPNELWHLDMTVGLGRRARPGLPDGRDRLLHPRDRRLAPRAPLPRHRRASRSIERAVAARRVRPRDADARHRQRLGVHRPRVRARPLRARDRPSPRRLPRPREPGLHRVLVLKAQGTLRLAA